jgi:hypothetical protein
MTNYPAGEVELRAGARHPVAVDDTGRWVASMGERLFTAATRDALRDQLMRATARKAVKVAVPFTMLMPPRFRATEKIVRHGTATGVHQGTGSVLVTWENGSKEQLNAYSATTLREMSPEEEAQWLELDRASRDARRALDDFEGSRRLRLRDEVNEAVETATTETLKPEGE